MQLRLKKDINYQPSPQKNVEEKWRAGEKSSFDLIGLEKVKCAGNEAPGHSRCLRFLLKEKDILPAPL